MKLVRLVDVIFCEIRSLNRATKIIESRIESRKQEGLLVGDNRAKLSLDLIREDAEYDHKRLRIIEDKAKVTVIGIIIALTLFASVTDRFSPPTPFAEIYFKLIVGTLDVLTIMSVLYFLTAAYFALKAISPKQIYRVTLQDEVSFERPEERQARYLKILDLNKDVVLKSTNFAHVSYNATRNGIVAIVLLVTLLALTNLSSHLTSRQEKENSPLQERHYDIHGKNIIIEESPLIK